MNSLDLNDPEWTDYEPVHKLKAQRALEIKQKEIQANTIYRGIPPKMNDIGSRTSNRERTSSRDLTVSKWARPIGTGKNAKTDKVRFIDGDLMEIHDTCKRVIVFLEASKDPERAVTYTKKLAESVSHTAYAMRIIHAAKDPEGLKGILHLTVWKNGIGVPICNKKNITVGEWQCMMENLIIHHEKTECAKYR